MNLYSHNGGPLLVWYLFILIGTLLEGELTMVVAGFAVFHGDLSLAGVVTAAFLGAFLGDCLFFNLGRRKGKSWLDRFPKLARRTAKAADLLNKWPIFTLFILRFQIAMRMFGNFTLGTSVISRKRYLYLNAAACLTWSLVIAALCFYFAQIMTGIWSSVQKP